MVSNYPEIHQLASSRIQQPPNYSYFTEQAIRAGYMEPPRTRHEHFGYHLHQQNPYPQTHFFPPPHSHEMREVLQREIEKERMREEMIMAEIVRMRAEERRVQLMRERELALRRGANSSSVLYGSSSVIGFASQRVPLLGTRGEDRSVLTLSEMERLNWRC
ncbi:hypothetical protein CASFOL_013813 [Castilleja foliolosa]|uniref:Uncharacterized protein n=1 Tax=Castilleja foliolosa TaxID=1961234 RepID=A0ABD3DL31_9LAMI